MEQGGPTIQAQIVVPVAQRPLYQTPESPQPVQTTSTTSLRPTQITRRRFQEQDEMSQTDNPIPNSQPTSNTSLKPTQIKRRRFQEQDDLTKTEKHEKIDVKKAEAAALKAQDRFLMPPPPIGAIKLLRKHQALMAQRASETNVVGGFKLVADYEADDDLDQRPSPSQAPPFWSSRNTGTPIPNRKQSNRKNR